jgi:hypothetical protein
VGGGGKRREPERLALQTNEQKFEEVLQQMKTFLKGAMPIPADLIRKGIGKEEGREEREKKKGEREGGREVPVGQTREPRVRISIPKRFTNICRSFRSFITFFTSADPRSNRFKAISVTQHS